jgi:hypothetical protein
MGVSTGLSSRSVQGSVWRECSLGVFRWGLLNRDYLDKAKKGQAPGWTGQTVMTADLSLNRTVLDG